MRQHRYARHQSYRSRSPSSAVATQHGSRSHLCVRRRPGESSRTTRRLAHSPASTGGQPGLLQRPSKWCLRQTMRPNDDLAHRRYRSFPLSQFGPTAGKAHRHQTQEFRAGCRPLSIPSSECRSSAQMRPRRRRVEILEKHSTTSAFAPIKGLAPYFLLLPEGQSYRRLVPCEPGTRSVCARRPVSACALLLHLNCIIPCLSRN